MITARYDHIRCARIVECTDCGETIQVLTDYEVITAPADKDLRPPHHTCTPKEPARMTRTATAAVAILGFLACILAANYFTTTHGMVPVGFGLIATAGTYFAGLTFVLRDAVQDTAGKRAVIATIAAGAILSFAVAAPFIALASAAAFALAELTDFLVYTPLRRRGYIRAAIASNIVGSFVDTVVFLAIAGFPIWAALPGQMLAKLTITAAVVLAVAAARTRRRVAA